MLRTMTLLIRSFDNEDSSELRGIFIKMTELAIEMVQKYTGNATIRDAALQLLNRMIVTTGVEILPYANKLLNSLSGNLDLGAFTAILHMSHLVLQTLKTGSHAFIAEIFPFCVNYAINFGIPKESVSDIEKSHLNEVKAFLKLVKLLSTHNITILYEQSVLNFGKMVNFIESTTKTQIDDLRKTGLTVISLFLANSVGLLISSDKITFQKSSKPVAYEEKYRDHANLLVEKSLEVAFYAPKLINLNNPLDFQSIQDIAILHYVLYRINNKEFVDKLSESWTIWKTNIDNIKHRLFVCNSSGSVSEYKELIKQILIKENKNSKIG